MTGRGDRLSALVLAGGTARRLGGVDKPALLVDGTSLLDRVLAALPTGCPVVGVGPERGTARPASWVREDPPGGGPTAALAAGLPAIATPSVALLAADLPFLDAATIRLLADAAGGHDGALLVDGDGREQWLCGVWSTAALRAGLRRAALAGPVTGAPLRRVLGNLDAVRVSAPPRPGSPAVWFDCDTAADLDAARRHHVTEAGTDPDP